MGQTGHAKCIKINFYDVTELTKENISGVELEPFKE